MLPNVANFTGFYLMVTDLNNLYSFWVLPSFTGFYRVLIGFLMNFSGFCRVQLVGAGLYRVLPSFSF